MDIFTQLSIVIVLATVAASVARILKQPMVIGYIVAGLIVGPLVSQVFGARETLSIFSEMGITILLFIVGLHLNPKEFTHFGKQALLLGTLQVVFTAAFGFLIAFALNYSILVSLYLGIALSFSSTIIVLKYLSDKRDLEKLYGRIAIGILLLQDIVASLALVFFSAFSEDQLSLNTFGFLLAKGVALILAVSLVGKFVFPVIGKHLAKSQEYLFMFAISWGFGLASLFGLFGFSLEIGALVAGVALSLSPYSQEVSSRLKPLRDFFVVLFFVTLGTQISITSLQNILLPIIVFSLFTLLLKPVIVSLLMEFFSYNKKTSFLEGASLAQISEFSIILVLLGHKAGQIDVQTVSVITITSVITIAVSSYFMMYSERLYPIFAPLLKPFEHKYAMREASIVSNYDVVLFGCNRVGYDFIRVFKHLGSGFLAVDFDPVLIESMQRGGVNCVYGDAEDGEFLNEIGLSDVKSVISTIPDYEVNAFLVKHIRSQNKKSLVLVLSYNIDEALRLYELGASYVVLPHFISGEYAAKMAFENGMHLDIVTETKKSHIKYLKERKKLDHAHPTWSHHG